MRKYELTVIFHPAQVEEGKKVFKEIADKRGITVLTEEDWGSKKLAYLIDEQREGFYYFTTVEVAADAFDKIERDFLIQKSILRHMFVRLEKTA